jgi:hypothetical protein
MGAEDVIRFLQQVKCSRIWVATPEEPVTCGRRHRRSLQLQQASANGLRSNGEE